jgi:hypothetical protein
MTTGSEVRKVGPSAARRQRLRRGQSMVEYSVVSHALLLIGATSMLGIGQYLRLFEALDTYLKSIYLVLRLGAV